MGMRNRLFPFVLLGGWFTWAIVDAWSDIGATAASLEDLSDRAISGLVSLLVKSHVLHGHTHV